MNFFINLFTLLRKQDKGYVYESEGPLKPKKKKKVVDEAPLKKKKKKKLSGVRGSDVAKKGGKKKKKGKSEEIGVVKISAKTAAAEASKEETSSSDYMKLSDGKNMVLILPPTLRSGRKLPWLETKVHYLGDDIAKILGIDLPDDIDRSYKCDKFHEKEECSGCQKESELKRARSGRDRKLGKALWARTRYYAHVIDLKNIESGVQKLPFGKIIHTVLVEALQDGEVFCDPDGLIPVLIRKKGAGMSTRYTCKIMSSSAVKKLKKVWLKQMHALDLEDAIPAGGSDELKEALESILDDAGEDGDDDDDYSDLE